MFLELRWIIFLDWVSKRELYITLLLRAYSQGVYNPIEIIGRKPLEDDFIGEVTGILKTYMTNKIIQDTKAIEREVCKLLLYIVVLIDAIRYDPCLLEYRVL